MAMDLFRFMESFNKGVAGDTLILPTNCLELWFHKFDAKFRRCGPHSSPQPHAPVACEEALHLSTGHPEAALALLYRNPEFLMQSGEKMPG